MQVLEKKKKKKKQDSFTQVFTDHYKGTFVLEKKKHA